MSRLVARTTLLSLVASACVVAGPAVTANAVTTDQPATPTAVEVFTADPSPDAPELAADAQFALGTALERTEAKPGDLAPPYVDTYTGKLYAPTVHETSADAEAPIVVDYATLPDPGTDLADEPEDPPPPGEEAPLAQPARFAAADPLPTTGTKTFYPIVRQVKYSQAALDATVDDAITADVPGKDNIVATYVQEDHNRVVVEANAVTEDMRTALAAKYGSDKVAIYLDPTSQRPAPASRNNDTNPFKGGSAAFGCTNGFSWNNGSKEYMVTAGHCADGAGLNWWMSDGSRVGTTTKYDTWEDWGSVKLPGQNTYAGDAALIEMWGANDTIGKLYTGNRTSNSSRDVARSELAYKGKKYCTGGKNKGVICNWKIDRTALTTRYRDGSVARNMFRGKKKGWCLWAGDSGGPVYTTQSNGKIVAKGLISGAAGGGGDHFAGRFDGDPCIGWFSEIVRAEKAFPGAITRRP
ncbi:hypothetical protein ACFVYA_37125 [Amycolatopsis sp. NPDC058278]|uniref:hypothetical protein n=1 Tax=Amycolatopsis sp. NPDC058278 TaxID=3346417 RepID=UPI0036D7E522